MALVPFDLQRSILPPVSSNTSGTAPLWMLPSFSPFGYFQSFCVDCATSLILKLLKQIFEVQNIIDGRSALQLNAHVDSCRLKPDLIVDRLLLTFERGGSSQSISPHGRLQYSSLASRWRGFFRFLPFTHNDACLLTHDLWKWSGVGLPNLSPPSPQTPEHPFHLCYLPHCLPTSLSIQGAESPRWQF